MIYIPSRFLGLILPFLTYTGLLLIGSFLFENGAYSDEIEQFGHYVGATEQLLLYVTISLILFCFFWLLIPKAIRNSDLKLFHGNYLLLVFIAALIYFSVPIFMYGPAFLKGLNRYQFNDLPLVYTFNIKIYMGVLCAALGVYITLTEGVKRYIGMAIFLGIIFINFSYGEKASGLLVAFTNVFAGILIGINRRISIISLILFVFFSSVFLISVYFVQLGSLGLDFADILAHFTNRLARQGQLWWKMVDICQQNQTQVLDNPFSIFTGYFEKKYTDSEGGMRQMMKLIMPKENFLKHSGSLAGGYPTILLLAGRNFLELSILMTPLYFFPYIVTYFLSFKSKVLFYTLPFSAYFMGVHIKIFQSGNTYLFSSPKYIICLIFLIIVGFETTFFISSRLKKVYRFT